jgi:hypothetical protein
MHLYEANPVPVACLWERFVSSNVLMFPTTPAHPDVPLRNDRMPCGCTDDRLLDIMILLDDVANNVHRLARCYPDEAAFRTIDDALRHACEELARCV